MDSDEDKIDEAALALFYLILHKQRQAWKPLDWDLINRLYEKGLTHDPISKTKSAVLLDESQKKTEELLKVVFCKPLYSIRKMWPLQATTFD